ncbi:hypothetical protein COL23_25720 [Priestia aryabhattai]|uniref:replication-relaxation family protein n=1 Tax=Priestia aryabhattai TaxID=412384 RepID=UPI000BF575FE|nr:replication-relaxation family protein [Priestia aryabhattai]PFW72152.1 hypothetical protein COL23_25720 [Priestia aryabhattai]
MNERDKAILNDLQIFRFLSRDQIVQLHFSGLKNPINSTNSVLKRLTRDGYIRCLKNYSPYLYTLTETKIKDNSQKIQHFLELVNTVIEMKKYKEPKFLMIEPKFSKKGCVEPDIFCRWHGNPLFVEVQRNLYSKETMQKKIDLYGEYFEKGDWRDEPWQVLGKEKFPSILIITPTRYSVESSLKIYQAPSISDFMDHLQGNQTPKPPISKPPVIKSNNGSISLRMK